MQTVGTKLRQARLQQNLSLDEVYRQTKVHPHVLEALEEDRAHNFLSFIYIKGFLKAYAQYLGLDGEKLLKEYIESQNLATPAVAPTVKKKPKIFLQFNPSLVAKIVIGIVLTFAFISYLRFVLRRFSPGQMETTSQKVKVRVVPAPAVQAEDLTLEVKALNSCWMRVVADNQTIFEKTLSKGKRERWQAKESIELRIGKPEALEVLVNGKSVDLKKAGVKRTLVITPAGIEGK